MAKQSQDCFLFFQMNVRLQMILLYSRVLAQLCIQHRLI